MTVNGRDRVTLSADHVRAPKTAEFIAGLLRRRIITGDLREGDSLPSPTELTTSLGVSRPTLREAFRILESQSLISVRRGAKGGATVRRPDVGVAALYAGALLQTMDTTIDDVNVARRVIEPAAVRMLARNRPIDAIDRLREIVRQETATVDDKSFPLVATQFHVELVALSGNKTLAVMTGMLREILAAHIAPKVSRRTEEETIRLNRRAVKAHLRLLALIESGDGNVAAEYWSRHLEAVDELVAQAYGRTTVLDLLS